jgi:hypothetical protein
LAKTWQRLEKHWEDNPGFVAAAAAGSLGLLLTAAMLMNAGIGWLQQTPVGEELADESRDLDESDLGDSSDEEILVTSTGNRFAKSRNRHRDAFQVEDEEALAESGPSLGFNTRGRSTASQGDEDAADDNADDSMETEISSRIAKVDPPSRRQMLFDDDVSEEESDDRSTERDENLSDEAIATLRMRTAKTNEPEAPEDENGTAADEAASDKLLAEMPVASQPKVLQPFEMDDDESSITDEFNTDGMEEEPQPPEPGRLEFSGKRRIADEESKLAKSDDEDDDRIVEAKQEPNRSIDLIGGPAERTAPTEDAQWKQQHARGDAKDSGPAVAAQQSQPVATKVLPVPQMRSAPVVKESRMPPQKSAAPPLRLAISGPPSVAAGKRCQVEIRVTNTGSVPAKHLVVWAELPQGLVHEVAQSLEQQIDTLLPGATYRALLHLRGQGVGEQTIRAEVGTGDRAALRLSANVRVVSASDTATVVGSDDCFCAPLVR